MSFLELAKQIETRLRERDSSYEINEKNEINAQVPAEGGPSGASPGRKAVDEEGEKEVRAHNATAREELDQFFTQEIAPRLITVYKKTGSKNCISTTLWQEVERLWNLATEGSTEKCPVERVKELMRRAADAAEGSSSSRTEWHLNLFGPDENPTGEAT